ncbi:MAG: hypothetical protein A2X80_08355 [Geobacteraceae bacterium GWB2_52_12]|nr:MAG: hypothetical protein A2X80_08355 [Geobacteraceae bacterium GWB2_52_12]
MKCPKCGHNSFEFHDACNKCSHDLTAYKTTYGLKPIVIPQAARVAMAANVVETAMGNQQPIDADETADMFSFDLPDNEPDSAEAGAVTASPNDPFNFAANDTVETSSFGEFSFDDEPAPELPAAAPPLENDDFSNLLESTTQDDPFSLPDNSPAPAAPVQSKNDSGEFDLDNFSWDEPAPTDAPKPEEDFNNLFGNKDEKK